MAFIYPLQRHITRHLLHSAINYEQETALCRQRLICIIGCYGLAFLIIIFRLFDVSLFDQSQPSYHPMMRAKTLEIQRKNIVDRNNIILATNLTTDSLYADATKIIDAQEAALSLISVFPDLKLDIILKRLQSNRKFVWIKRNLTPIEKHKVIALGIPGVDFKREEKRVYPHGHLASHILGYVNVDGRGIAGVEKQFNQLLQDSETAATPLQLSMDIRIQHILHDELSKAVSDYKAIGGTAIVADSTNGEIIAMVSLPDFDPHHPAKTSDNQRFNRATLGVYEMGSTFKPLTTAIALDSGTVDLTDSYDVSKPLKVANYTITDLHPKKDQLSIAEILIHSSNIGTAKMAADIGSDVQQHFFETFGLLKPLSIEIPETSAPLLPKNWREINTMTIGYGYGIAVTPLHLVQAIGSLVNGGVFHPATLQVQAEEVSTDTARTITSKTSDKLRQLLRLVVKYGTGSKANAKGYMVGGKTGTAKKLTDAGGYDEDATLSSFIGVFPMNEPKYVILAMLDEPKGNQSTFGINTGGFTAAPIIANVVKRMAPVVGIIPTNESTPDVKQEFWVNRQLKKLAYAAN